MDKVTDILYIRYHPVGSSPACLDHNQSFNIDSVVRMAVPSFTLNMSRSDVEEMTFEGVIDVKK